MGNRMWGPGQSRGEPIQANWEEGESVKTMFLVNLAKYVAHPKLRTELVQQTEDWPLKGGASTANWSKWNGLIQTKIRDLVASGAFEGSPDGSLLKRFEDMQAAQLCAELEKLVL